MGRPPNRGQVAAIATAAVALLGAAGGGGYYLAPATHTADVFPMDRGMVLERLQERDREEFRQVVHALQENTNATVALQQAVVGFTEWRNGVREQMNGLETRVRALETGGMRPASMRR